MFDIGLKNGLGGVTFVASNLENLPKFGPEEFNLTAVVDRQVRADAANEYVSPASDQSVELTKQLIIDAQQKMDSLCVSVNARLDHMSNVCKSSINSSLQA